jgi:thiamine monophosphate synthase
LELGKLAEVETPPDFVILREKFNLVDYRRLAEKLLPVFKEKLIVHSRPELADELGTPLHLPFAQAVEVLQVQELNHVPFFSISVHSVADLQELEKLPVHSKQRIAFLLAGHVFSTPSHPGVAGRGLDFLRACVENSPRSIVAVGGINNSNLPALENLGLAGWAGISEFAF